jgi:hypothetical protein
MVTKINPVFDIAQPRSFLTKSISTFDIDLNVDASGSNAPFEVVDRVLQTIALRATIVAHTALTGTGQLMSVWLEGEFPDDDYNGTAGTETFAAQLQADIRALGTIDALSLAGATVVAGVVFRADQV